MAVYHHWGAQFRRALCAFALHGAHRLTPLGVILPTGLAAAWTIAGLGVLLPGLVPIDLGPDIGLTDVLIFCVLAILVPFLIAPVIGRIWRRALLRKAKAGAFDAPQMTAAFIATEPAAAMLIWAANTIGWIVLALFPFWLIGVLTA